MINLNNVVGNKLGEARKKAQISSSRKVEALASKVYKKTSSSNFILKVAEAGDDEYFKAYFELGQNSEINRVAAQVCIERGLDLCPDMDVKINPGLPTERIVNPFVDRFALLPIIKVVLPKSCKSANDIFSIKLVSEKATGLKRMIIGYSIPEDCVLIDTLHPITWTASSEKNRTLFAVSAKDMGIAEDIVNRVSYLDKRGNDDATMKQVVKRLGLFASSSINCGDILKQGYSVVLLKKPFYTYSDCELLEEGDTHQHDGMCILGSSYVQNVIGGELGTLYGLSPRDISFQVRVQNCFGKCCSTTMDDYELNYLANREDAVVIGEKDAPVAVVMDCDGYKVEPVMGAPFNLHILCVAKTTNSNLLNVQVLNKMPVNEDSINRLAKTAIESIDSIKVEEVEIPIATVTDATRVNNCLLSYSETSDWHKERISNDRHLWKTTIKANVRELSSKISKGKLPSEDVYFSRVLFESNPCVGLPEILDASKYEAFSKDILDAKADEISEIENDDTLTLDEKDAKLAELLSGVIVKNPSPGEDEYEKVVFLTKNQIKRRASKDIRAAFNLINSSYGTITLACSALIKSKLAGFDTDFDGMSIMLGDAAKLLLENKSEKVTLIKR